MRDESLEDAFSRRDAAAYEAAYHRYGTRMTCTALRMLRDADTARECVHDVLLDLWRRKGSYDKDRGSLEAFLVTCVRNRALMRMRGESRRRAMLERLDPSPEYTLEEDPIERERIERAICQLPEAQADVIRLAYYRDFTLAQVATELNAPIGTIKGRLSSALRALRVSLVVENQ